MFRYQIKIEYDGTDFVGWQKQENGPSIQSSLEDAIKKITSEIKNSKMKIQAKINGNELRIDGKKRDDLQAAMKLIEDLQTGIPIQFINFRD